MKRNGKWVGHPVMTLAISDRQGFVIGVSGLVKTWPEYLRTPWWRFLSHSRKIADGNRCSFCGSYNRLEVHHSTYKNVGTLLEWQNLITLCRRCHGAVHEFLRYDDKLKHFVHIFPYEDTRSDEVKEFCDDTGCCECTAEYVLGLEQ